MINVTVWNESTHKGKAYPEGMNAAIKSIFDGKEGYSVKTALLKDAKQGLPDEVLNNTDVLLWWGHCFHGMVKDELVERIFKRVDQDGMGAIVLHSGHESKVFKRLMGTHCSLSWREEENEAERILDHGSVSPHSRGCSQGFRLDREEMYGEYFDIPKPDSVVFTGWFSGGEVFRSGCTFTRGEGRVFYFQPGHETFPIYYDENIRRIIENAVVWAAKKDSGKTDFISEGKSIHIKTPPEVIHPAEKKKWLW